jgi:hypothetical protein
MYLSSRMRHRLQSHWFFSMDLAKLNPLPIAQTFYPLARVTKPVYKST